MAAWWRRWRWWRRKRGWQRRQIDANYEDDDDDDDGDDDDDDDGEGGDDDDNDDDDDDHDDDNDDDDDDEHDDENDDAGDDGDDDENDDDDGSWKSFIFYWKFLANKNLRKHQFNGLSIESLNRWQILKIFLNSKINPLIPLENWLKLKIKSQDDDQHVWHEPDGHDWHPWVWKTVLLHPAVEGHVWELWQGQVKILMNISIDADMLVPKASALL